MRLSETLDEKALKTLMRTMGLCAWFPEEYSAWEERRIEIGERFRTIITQRQEEIHEILTKAFGALWLTVREAVKDEILKAFP